MRDAGVDISKHNALIASTAHKFHRAVGMEEEDLRQELSIKAFRAMCDFKPDKGRAEGSWVYGYLANLIKDMLRDAARRRNGPLEVVHMEGTTDQLVHKRMRQEAEDVFRAVENGSFVMPEGVTDMDEQIIFLLVIGHRGTEVAKILGVEYALIEATMRILRVKFAALRPSPPLVAAA